ncbi:hypothetical protein HY251_14660 [bacterium]|nr:hypothetical protein [bacterium]
MDARRFVFLHFEKAAAGIFLAWLFLGAGQLAAPPAGVGESARLSEQVSQIDAHMSVARVELPPVADYAREFRRQLDPPERAAPAFPDWCCHRRPNLVVEVPRKPGPIPSAHEPPTGLKVIASHGKVALSWEHATGNEHVRVSRYEVWRASGGGAFEKLAELSPEAKAYEDRSVTPRSKYSYRIVDHVEVSPDDAGGREITPPDRPELEIEASCETPRDVLLTLVEATSADPVLGVAAKAQLQVWTWDAVKGVFGAPKNVWSVTLGDKIQGTDAVLASVSRTKMAGREVGTVSVRWPDGTIDELGENVLPHELPRPRTGR